MKQLSKLTLASAIAATLAGGLTLPVQVSAAPALSVDDVGQWSAEQLGDVLLFPYYSVRDFPGGFVGEAFRTSFTITNTDPVNSVVLKFRLRDAVHSRDVIDFIMILSPNDEVVAYMDRDPQTNLPRINFPTDETSCRVPWAGGVSTINTQTNELGQFIDRTTGAVVPPLELQDGHLEVIPMGSFTAASEPGSLAVHTRPASGPAHTVPANCDRLSRAFENAVDGNAVLGQFANAGVTAVGNVLRGAYTITADESGFSAGGSALPIADWDDAQYQQDPPLDNVPGLLFGQNTEFADPTQLDGLDNRQYDHPHLGDLAATANIDNSDIGAGAVANNWSSNPTNGVGIDWVVTYFTKYLWRDFLGFYGDAAPYAWPQLNKDLDGNYTGTNGTGPNYLVALGNAINRMPYNLTLGEDGDPPVLASNPTSPWTQAIGEPSVTNGGRCIRVTANLVPRAVYDREEQRSPGTISPSVPGNPLDFCDETNVLSFVQNTGMIANRKAVLRTNLELGSRLLVSGTPQAYGWANIMVNSTALQSGVLNQPTIPVAVNGFAFTKRDLGNSGNAYGSIVDHTLRNTTPNP